MSIYFNLQRLRNTPLYHENLWEIQINAPIGLQLPNAYFLAQEVTFPPEVKFTTEEEKATKRDLYVNYENPKNISINFIETENLDITNWIESWIDSFFTQDGRFRVGVDPRLDMNVRLQKFGLAALAINTASVVGGQTAGLGGLGVATGVGLGLATGNLGNIASATEGLDDIKTYTFEGCRYLNRTEWTLTYSSSELKIITVELSVENIKRKDLF